MSRSASPRKKRPPSLPVAVPSEFDGFGSPESAGADEGWGFDEEAEAGAASSAIESFVLSSRKVAGLDLSCTKSLKALHEHEGRWVDLVKVTGSDTPLIRKTLRLGKASHSSPDTAYLKTVKNELELLHKFDSPLIVHHYGSILTDANEVQIFMEEMNAGSLDNLLPRVGRMHEKMLARVCHCVGDAMAYLWNKHRAIHRDIKPGNTLINTAGLIKLCDFGTSRILEGPGANGVTFIGTMHYMSPERLEGKHHGVSGDVFSLGLMLMELATGYPRIPMDRDKYPHPEVAVMRQKGVKGFKVQPKYQTKRIAPFDVMKEISTLDIPFPKHEKVAFSDELLELTRTMLEKDPEARPSLEAISANHWTKSGLSQEETVDYVTWALEDPE
mmetsp:Transcript_23182/g.60633  ORF Transcript_23182/g.60633 Transcript_23182/m.60633 type:complete len:386 (-) Transcript_23182:156-1313(-)